jgi:hypothetical protein
MAPKANTTYATEGTAAKGFGQDRQWNWRNFLICSAIACGQVAFGYPASIIGVTLAQPSFLIYMKLLDTTTDPPSLVHNADSLIGAMSGVFQVCTSQVDEALPIFINTLRRALFWASSLEAS